MTSIFDGIINMYLSSSHSNCRFTGIDTKSKTMAKKFYWKCQRKKHTTMHAFSYCCPNIPVLCVVRLSNLWINWCNWRVEKSMWRYIECHVCNTVDWFIKSALFGVRVFYCHRTRRAVSTSFFSLTIYYVAIYWSWQLRERDRKVNETQICVNLKRSHYRRHNVAGHIPVKRVKWSEVKIDR